MMQRRVFGLIAMLLVVEFLDEFAYSIQTAAWPLIRQDLNLSYTQIGLALTIPSIVSAAIEPLIGILGDVWQRRLLVVGGGLIFGLTLIAFGLSGSYLVLLLAFSLQYPSSGAFVGLAQATLMDREPERHQQAMARWTFVGSIAYVVGPLILSGVLLLGGGWRGLMISIGLSALCVALLLRRFQFPSVSDDEKPESIRDGLARAVCALKRGTVIRWLVMLTFSDLMLDILFTFVALYLADVVGLDGWQVALSLTVWTGVGLIGDFLLIPLLERIDGMHYLRLNVVVVACLYPLFLLADGFTLKLVLLGLLGLLNAGWYAILKAGLYSAMPGQSGTVLTLTNITGLAESFFPLLLGIIASRFGLTTTMWLLMAGPLALIVGLNLPFRPQYDVNRG